jgi:hypothetical protein
MKLAWLSGRWPDFRGAPRLHTRQVLMCARVFAWWLVNGLYQGVCLVDCQWHVCVQGCLLGGLSMPLMCTRVFAWWLVNGTHAYRGCAWWIVYGTDVYTAVCLVACVSPSCVGGRTLTCGDAEVCPAIERALDWYCCLSACLSVYLSVRLLVCCPSVFLFVCLRVSRYVLCVCAYVCVLVCGG